MSKFSVADIINACAFVTERDGYVKRTEDQTEQCTADSVLDLLVTKSLTTEDIENVKERVSEWFEYINNVKLQKGEYFDNLRKEVSKPLIEESKVGFIASSFASFDRNKSFKMRDNQDKESVFLGEEGDNIVFNISEWRLMKSGFSKFKNAGKWYLYKIKDEYKNIIIYFADHACEAELSQATKASATVSKLSTFNDVKQTNVSKVKFL